MTRVVGASYDQLPDFDPGAVPHFKAMKEETGRQFEFLTSARKHGGMGINVDVTKENPYDDAPSMMRDLHENRHISVLSTASTGGHPYFSNDENDKFRAVHDTFGHAALGRGFDRHGEEAAFQAHSQMYSAYARRAMATETRGQNSAFISAGGGDNFVPQKVALLPEPFSRPIVPVVGRRTGGLGAMQARQFHSATFGTSL